MSFLAKHQPQSFRDLVFADDYVARVAAETAQNRRHQHLILHGPRGSGKSETARLILKGRIGAEAVDAFAQPIHAKIYSHDHFEPILRTWDWQISQGAQLGCTIIEEVDQFSDVMQHKLRAFVDHHQTGIIIATTNNLHRLDAPLQDRCRCLCVEYPTSSQWVDRAREVLAAEGIELDPPQVCQLLTDFRGSGRELMRWLEEFVFDLQFMTEKVG